MLYIITLIGAALNSITEHPPMRVHTHECGMSMLRFINMNTTGGEYLQCEQYGCDTYMRYSWARLDREGEPALVDCGTCEGSLAEQARYEEQYGAYGHMVRTTHTTRLEF